MSRIIKFRIWKGDYFELIGFTNNDPCKFHLDNPNINPSCINQFTGFTDRENKEIYEGDILELDKETRKCFGVPEFEGKDIVQFGLVGFERGCWMIGRSVEDPTHLNTYLWVLHDYAKAVGNIYENAELLKI